MLTDEEVSTSGQGRVSYRLWEVTLVWQMQRLAEKKEEREEFSQNSQDRGIFGWQAGSVKVQAYAVTSSRSLCQNIEWSWPEHFRLLSLQIQNRIHRARLALVSQSSSCCSRSQGQFGHTNIQPVFAQVGSSPMFGRSACGSWLQAWNPGTSILIWLQ